MQVLRVPQATAVTLAVLVLAGCEKTHERAAVAAALQQQLSAPAERWSKSGRLNELNGFYAQRNWEPAWASTGNLSGVERAVKVLRTAPQHGFDPADYGDAAIAREIAALAALDKAAPERPARLAKVDLFVTSALLDFGHDVATGRTSPSKIDRRWKARRKAPDVAGALAQQVKGDLLTWIGAVRPPHSQYAALEKALIDLRAQRDKGGWPTLPVRPFKRGESHPSVATLRQRLVASGHLSGESASNGSTLYDDRVATAVSAFQEHHAIKATGVADAATLKAMNVSIEDRIRQVELNAERWRWMPDDLGPRHLLVNIPSFHLLAQEHNQTVMDIRVVVGKLGNETPVFSGDMATVVFSPYWNVPESIVEGETAPAAARDPEYLARNSMEVMRVTKSGTSKVDPSSVNWDDPEEVRQLAFRQKPGSHNALGHVKFLFPNPFDVYLHDTPADALFARPGRAFSHGCVRVEEPETLARYVLRGYEEWPNERIAKAMLAGVEQPVKLRETIPVHIAYFTTWVDEKGGLHFHPDIYGYDARQTEVRK